MSTTTYSAANLQWLGLARETTSGTAAAAPTVFVPISSPVFTQPTTSLPDNALRGSMAKTFGVQQGNRHAELTYTTYSYLDSVYHHVLAALGTADAVTGAADPWTHKTALLNAGQPPSFTIWYFDSSTGGCWQIVGAKSNNLKIDAKTDALTQIDAGWMGISAQTVTAPANTPTVDPPMPSWTTTISVGGTALAKYSEVAWTVKRATEAILTLNGTQAATAIFCGELEVTGDLTGIYQGTTDNDWTDYLANTQPAIVVGLHPAGDTTHGLSLQTSKVAYTDASFSGTNKWMEIKSKLEAVANATDALDSNLSPMLATLTTPVSTAY